MMEAQKKIKNGRIPISLHKKLLGSLKSKRKTYRQSKDEQTTKKAYQEMVRTCRDEIRKAKKKQNKT